MYLGSHADGIGGDTDDVRLRVGALRLELHVALQEQDPCTQQEGDQPGKADEHAMPGQSLLLAPELLRVPEVPERGVAVLGREDRGLDRLQDGPGGVSLRCPFAALHWQRILSGHTALRCLDQPREGPGGVCLRCSFAALHRQRILCRHAAHRCLDQLPGRVDR